MFNVSNLLSFVEQIVTDDIHDIDIDKYECGSRGGDRGSGPPPGKSQVIWVSIGNKRLDPHWKKLDPPPPLENVGPPLKP